MTTPSYVTPLVTEKTFLAEYTKLSAMKLHTVPGGSDPPPTCFEFKREELFLPTFVREKVDVTHGDTHVGRRQGGFDPPPGLVITKGRGFTSEKFFQKVDVTPSMVTHLVTEKTFLVSHT